MGGSGTSLYHWCVANNREDLLSEWDNEKNEALTPRDIGYGSVRKVWWVCPQGHSYDTKPNARTANCSGCPYCKNQKFKSGYNDLQTVYPEVAQYWDTEKNGVSPDQVIAGGHRKAWWKCEKGHSWQAEVIIKIEDHHCHYCSGRKAVKGETDLETLFPDLAGEWNFEKNELLPSEVTVSSARKVWWKCKKCGTAWRALISNRTRDNGATGSGCPQCTKELAVSFPEKVVYHYIHKGFKDSLENIRSDYFPWLGKMSVDIYIPSLKLGIEYDGGWHTEKKDLRKDKLCADHNIDLIRIRDSRLPSLGSTSVCFTVQNRNEDDLKKAVEFIFEYISGKHGIPIDVDIDINRDRGIAYAEMNLQQKKKSLESQNPELAKEWNYAKNGGLRPNVVTVGSSKKVWWVCEKGHEWSATVASRNAGNGCPICAGKTAQKNHSSLSVERPDLVKYWDAEKNSPLTSDVVTVGSRKVIFWKCPDCGYQWHSKIISMKGCPVCKRLSELKAGKDSSISPSP